jgi:hypothetical protein
MRTWLRPSACGRAARLAPSKASTQCRPGSGRADGSNHTHPRSPLTGAVPRFKIELLIGVSVPYRRSRTAHRHREHRHVVARLNRTAAAHAVRRGRRGCDRATLPRDRQRAAEPGRAANVTHPDALTPPTQTGTGRRFPLSGNNFHPGVAQPGRAAASKTVRRGFDSYHPRSAPVRPAALIVENSTVDGVNGPAGAVQARRRPGRYPGRGRWLTRLIWDQETPRSTRGSRTHGAVAQRWESVGSADPGPAVRGRSAPHQGCASPDAGGIGLPGEQPGPPPASEADSTMGYVTRPSTWRSGFESRIGYAIEVFMATCRSSKAK